MLQSAMLDTLEELETSEFHKFKWWLREPGNVNGLPPLTKRALENAERTDTVDRMLETYATDAYQIMVLVLKKIKRRDLVEKFENTLKGSLEREERGVAYKTSLSGQHKGDHQKKDLSDQSDQKHHTDLARIKELEEEMEAERAACAKVEKQRDELSRDLERAVRVNRELEEDLRRSHRLVYQESIMDLQNDKQQSDQKIKELQACIKELEEGSAVAQLEKIHGQEMKKLYDAELRRIQKYAVDVTLDPDTAHAYLTLSEDGKQVSDEATWTARGKGIWMYLAGNKEQFSYVVSVLGKQSFSSGRFYFEVQVKGKTQWDVGVARESIERKGQLTASPDNGYWTIGLENRNEYWACADPAVLLPVRKQVQKVGVFVDYEEGLVSFYDVEARVHLYSFTGCSFTEKLYPYFSPCPNYGGTNSAPLIISPVSVA